jgi:hypothetical protein
MAARCRVVLRELPRPSVVPKVWAAVSGTTAGTADGRGRRADCASTGTPYGAHRNANESNAAAHLRRAIPPRTSPRSPSNPSAPARRGFPPRHSRRHHRNTGRTEPTPTPPPPCAPRNPAPHRPAATTVPCRPDWAYRAATRFASAWPPALPAHKCASPRSPRQPTTFSSDARTGTTTPSAGSMWSIPAAWSTPGGQPAGSAILPDPP